MRAAHKSIKQIRQELQDALVIEMKHRGMDPFIQSFYQNRFAIDLKNNFFKNPHNYITYNGCDTSHFVSLVLDIYERTLDI